MGTRMPKEANIADCEICKNIPQEFSSEEKILKLLTVIEMKSYYDCCGTSITKILKCPICSTYYYYNHYSEDSHYPHHFESDSLDIRRYDPVTTIKFLEGISNSAEGTLPAPTGALKEAFAEGRQVSEPEISDKANLANAAKNELEVLTKRYENIIKNLIEIIKKNGINGKIKQYILEALCNHFMDKGKFKDLGFLLDHNDPFIRVKTAHYLVGVATLDAPVTKLIHIPPELREKFKVDFNKLIKVFFEVLSPAASAIDDPTRIDIRYTAIYGLKVLAGRIKPETLKENISNILDILKEEKLEYDVYWLLRDFIEDKKKKEEKEKNSKIILNEIEKLDEKRREILSKYENKYWSFLELKEGKGVS